MKFSKYLLCLLSLVFLLSVVSFAQEEEMTVEEWQAEMNRLQEKKTSLVNEIDALKIDIDNLKIGRAHV